MSVLGQEFIGMPGDEESELQKAQEWKLQLEALLRDVDTRISQLQKIVDLKRQLQEIEVPPEFERAKRARQRNSRTPRELALLARDIIRKAGRPMTRSELTEAIEAQGIKLAGRDRVKNLGTILWRQQDLFVHIEDRGYWPKDDPHPE